MIKNIVFDLGGVIMHLDTDRAVKRFIEIGVSDATEFVNAYQQKGVFLELEEGLADRETFCKKLCEHTGKEITEEMAFYAWKGFIVDIPQYKLDYILNLRNNYKLYLLSNSSIKMKLISSSSAIKMCFDFQFSKSMISFTTDSFEVDF